MMGAKRDDFSEKTKMLAMVRAGTRCSFPGCNIATVGASMENAAKPSITGVAAHICAAAPGGPRYDERMTPEERKSINNCIWLCQTHAHLIDTDVKKYPAELLHQWKSQAEKASARDLADVDYISRYYDNNGDNISVLEQLFYDLIFEGRFSHLRTLLDQYRTKLSDVYEEFVLRYKIIYDVYCSRSNLNHHLMEYLELPVKTGIDDLVKLFVSFILDDELKKVINYCNSPELKQLANVVISKSIFDILFTTDKNGAKTTFSKELVGTMSNLIINYMWNKKIFGSFTMLKDIYSSYADEFYYRIIDSVQEIEFSVNFQGYPNDRTYYNDKLAFLRESIENISALDISLQKRIWENLLIVLLANKEDFKDFASVLPDELKKYDEIKTIIYCYQIKYELSTVSLNELLCFATRVEDYTVLASYAERLSSSEKESFFNEYGFLCKKDVSFLEIKYNLLYKNKPSEALLFLKQFEGIYDSDYSFHCLLATCLPEGSDLNSEYQWLNEHKGPHTMHEMTLLINALGEHQHWDDLLRLLETNLPYEIKYKIGILLYDSQNKSLYKTVRDIFQALRDKKWERRGLLFNLGMINESLGRFEDAKSCFKQDYDRYHEVASLQRLIELRFRSEEYIEDFYLEELKNYADATSQNLLGATYLKLINYGESKKYYLRSLLLDDSKVESLNGFWMAASRFSKESVNQVKPETVCILKSTKRSLAIAIHSINIMKGIVPNNFAGCQHFSAEDTQITCLLFHSVNEVVVFQGEDFTIVDIVASDQFFSKFFFSTLEGRDGVIAIKSSSPEDFVLSMKSILKESFDSINEILDEYNHAPIRLPIAALSAQVGKSMLITCEFLAFENREPIRNNLQYIEDNPKGKNFVFSFDTIVLLAHLGVKIADLGDLQIYCSSQVKNKLTNEILEESVNLESDNQDYMFYKEGQLSLVSPTTERKRNRYAFLARLKAMVDSIKTKDDVGDFVSNNPDLQNGCAALLSSSVLRIDRGTLALAKQIPNPILITDEQFLYAFANTERIPNMGLAGLLTALSTTRQELICFSKKLHSINFINYIPYFLYQKMDQMPSTDDIESEIQNWLLTDTEGNPTEHHESVIIALFKDYYQFGLNDINLENALRKAAICIVERRKPGFIQRCVLGLLQGTDESIDDPK